MAYLNELSRNTTKVNGDMAEIIQLNSKAAEEEKKIENAYREIGKLYYDNYADKNDKLFQTQVADIRASESLILEEVKRAITRVKGLIICPSCGSGQPLDSVFCNVCGTRLSGSAAIQPASAVKGAAAGTPIAEAPVLKEAKPETPVMSEAPTAEKSVAEAPAKNVEEDVCKVCGTPMAKDMLFCINCGTRRS